MTDDAIERLPPGARCVVRSDVVDEAIARMARDIERDVGGSEPIIMPILVGGAFTALKLAEHFRFPYEIDSLRVARYGGGQAGELHWYARPCLELAGRHILLVDDVLDRGITLHAVEHELRRMDVGAVSIAVLIRKAVEPRIERPAVDYVGIDGPDEYLFGCGMDLDGLWRGLPAIYAASA